MTGSMDEAPEIEARLRAFEREATALRASLHRYCARMVGSVIDGEDVLQEALAKAFTAIRNGDMPDKIRPWLFRIAHNCALDFLRGKARSRARESDADVGDIADESSLVEARIAAEASLSELMVLPPAQRGAVVLKDVLGHSLKEIGEILESSEASVKGALQRGRENLRKLAAASKTSSSEPMLDREEVKRLGEYVDAFNARDFDTLRGLLGPIHIQDSVL